MFEEPTSQRMDVVKCHTALGRHLLRVPTAAPPDGDAAVSTAIDGDCIDDAGMT